MTGAAFACMGASMGAMQEHRPLLARAKCVIQVWVSFNEHKWVNFDER